MDTTTTTKTLRDIIIARKTRKGEADNITKDGAYWETAINLQNGGGNGIGNNGSSVTHYLEVRHYRNGELRGYLNRHLWHQNDGTTHQRTRADNLLDCSTIEELIQTAKKHKIESVYDDSYEIEISNEGEKRLCEGLPEMPASEPAPDEV